MTLDSIVASVLAGVFNGFGSALGSYFALKHAIAYLERMPTPKEKVRELLARSEASDESRRTK